jgi:hypothetical protein
MFFFLVIKYSIMFFDVHIEMIKNNYVNKGKGKRIEREGDYWLLISSHRCGRGLFCSNWATKYTSV